MATRDQELARYAHQTGVTLRRHWWFGTKSCKDPESEMDELKILKNYATSREIGYSLLEGGSKPNATGTPYGTLAKDYLHAFG